MTLDEEYARYQGQSLLVPGATEDNRGQCVQWADYVLYDVYGYPYVWGNAIDFWNKFNSFDQLRENFNQITDGSIKKGDLVIFNQNVGSVYGHIDVAMNDGTVDNFTGADSNWGGNKTVHLVNHIGRQYVIGSLRLKGGTMGLTPEQVNKISVLASFAEAKTNQNFLNNAGLDLDTVLDNFLNYPTTIQFRNDALAYRNGQTATPSVTVNGTEYVPKG